jgi:F-type H+-transporting ATPase subunit a
VDPLHQFHIKPLISVIVADLDVSFSNSALSMITSVIIIYALMMLGMRRRSMVPGRWQSLAEIFYEFITKMVDDNAGRAARPFFPFIFTLFMFILVGNLLGMLPWAFTFTSHIVVTFAMAIFVFTMATLLALIKHGFRFFTFFLPHGVPLWLAPLLVPIEIVSYLSRPISLSVRLFANMMAGHTMLKVFAGFTVMMGAGLGALGYAAGIVPVIINIALIGFEIMVATLQAYVFAILTCLYIRDALELH